MIAIVNFTGERDPFSVRRPARLIVGFVVVRNLCELATFRTNHPNISISILFVLFPGPIRDKSEARSVRRPLRIAVVPIVAFGDLFRAARLQLDDPKVRPPVIKPPRVIELVRTVLVVTHVAAIFILSAVITGSNPADDHQTRSIRRPAKYADSIF